MELTLAAVEAARRRIAPLIVRTPLVRLNADTGAEVYLKLENLQPIGSFKLRGAANAMAGLPDSALARGVLTASAGNMAQGVCYCARARGVPATVIAPDTAPATKLEAIKRLGGRVILAPFAAWWRTFETRTYPGIDATFIHAFEDPAVMAGNGTIGLEILDDLPGAEAVVIPWGGGGLACGIATVIRALAPQVKIYAAEVETAAPLAAAWAAGGPRTVDYQPSFVDGIGSRSVFASMLELARPLLDGVIVVSLAEAAVAIRLAAERNRVIIEGAAACAMAACTAGEAGSGRVVAIISGGNLDLAVFARICADAAS